MAVERRDFPRKGCLFLFGYFHFHFFMILNVSFSLNSQPPCSSFTNPSLGNLDVV